MINRIKNGNKVPLFQFETPWTQSNNLYDTLQNKKTILVFLRFYGCTVCQLDIQRYISRNDEFIDKNAQVLVVLQTEPSLIREQISKVQMPLTIICDPSHNIFNLFGVEAAKSPQELMSEEAIEKVNIARSKGFKKIDNGEKENKLQLPATFIIDSDGTALYAHYAKHGADLPSIDEILDLI